MPETPRTPRPGGRQAEAARNDGRILDAARAVFLADPDAPVSAVAATAGVGISALYRRYPSKEELLRALAADGLRRYADAIRVALEDEGDPWEAYAACLHRIVEGQSQALAQRLAGTFPPTPELTALAGEAAALADRLFRRVRRAGVLRDDVSQADIVLLLETVASVELPGDDGGAALRRRYLSLLLQALRAPGLERLPGKPAREADLTARWRTRRQTKTGGSR